LAPGECRPHPAPVVPINARPGKAMVLLEAAATQRDALAHAGAALELMWREAHRWIALLAAPLHLLGARQDATGRAGTTV
jgi:hypothetical protein